MTMTFEHVAAGDPDLCDRAGGVPELCDGCFEERWTDSPFGPVLVPVHEGVELTPFSHIIEQVVAA